MDSPLVHIGYHKTATTWFQRNFYPYVRNAAYLDRRKVRYAFLNTHAFAFDPRAVQQALRISGRPIICEEELSGNFVNAGLLGALTKDVAYRIQAVYPDAQIIIFIRNQLEIIRATYLQYVRSGGSYSLRRFLFPYSGYSFYRKAWHKKPMLTPDHFAYQHLVRHYQAVFGPGKVHVFCYEDFAAYPSSFAKRFAERFELDIPVETLRYNTRNKSLGLFSMYLARGLGPFSRWQTPNRLSLLPVLPKWASKGLFNALNNTPLAGPRVTTRRLLGARLLGELHDRYAHDNRVLARETGLALEDLGYPMVGCGDRAETHAKGAEGSRKDGA